MKHLFAMVLVAVSPVLAADPSLTGSWKISLNVSGNTYPMVCAFQQDGEKLSGTCKGGDNSDNTLTGQVQGQKISFKHQTPYNGDMITLSYSGTVSSATEIKGAVDVQPFGVQGDFAGQKDAPAEGK
jgi:hypothetical protein